MALQLSFFAGDDGILGRRGFRLRNVHRKFSKRLHLADTEGRIDLFAAVALSKMRTLDKVV